MQRVLRGVFLESSNYCTRNSTGPTFCGILDVNSDSAEHVNNSESAMDESVLELKRADVVEGRTQWPAKLEYRERER